MVSSTKITAKTPAGAAGVVDVRVTTPSGTSAITTADHYTYETAPTITSVSPTSGTHLGGTTVTITGTNFTFVKAVEFGTAAATSFTVVSSTTITAKTPAEVVGTVPVRVVTAGGISALVSADNYSFT